MEDLMTFINEYSFVTVILIIIAVLTAIKQLWDMGNWFKKHFFDKYHEKMNSEEALEDRIVKLEEHDKWQYGKLTEIGNSIEKINNNIVDIKESTNKSTVVTCRSALWRMHSEFVAQDYVTREGLKTFIEMGKVYEDAGGDDIYHERLYPEVMKLKIRED